MDERYIIFGLTVTVAALIIVVINLVVGIIQCRAKIEQSQKDREQCDELFSLPKLREIIPMPDRVKKRAPNLDNFGITSVIRQVLLQFDVTLRKPHAHCHGYL